MQTIIADDFGLCPTHDAVILKLLERGSIDGTSAFVDAPINKNTLEHIVNLREERLCKVGLHLNLTENFTNKTNNPSVSKLLLKSAFGQLSRPSLAKDIWRQFDQFHNLFGFHPDYLDGHQHCHIFPIIAQELAQVVEARDLGHSFWVRYPDEVNTKGVVKSYLTGGLKALIVSRFAQRTRIHFESRDITMNKTFAGFLNLNADKDVFAKDFVSMLSNAPADAVIMVHPGSEDSKVLMRGHKNALRSIEALVLSQHK